MSSNCSSTNASSDAGEVKIDIVFRGIHVGRSSHDRGFIEIVFRRRRWRLPFQSGRAPRIRSSDTAVFQRPEKINQRQQITDAKDGCARCREHVEDLELWWIRVIAARISKVTENELREESEIESD